jgi:hypothetical protein
MSEHDPLDADALPDDVMQLVSGARRAASAQEPGEEARARMRARLAAALPLGFPPGSGPEGGGAPPEPSASSPSPMSTPPGTMAAPPSGLLARIPAWVAAATFVVGAATGALVGPRVSGPRPADYSVQNAPIAVPRAVDGPKLAPTPPDTQAAPTVDVRDLPRVASAQPASSAPSPASARPSTSDLTAERSLLDVARTALGRGDFANALVSADAHQKRFPKGALAEEREALAVQALAGAGRRDEARARAERFAKSFPGSILLPAVEAAGGVK